MKVNETPCEFCGGIVNITHYNVYQYVQGWVRWRAQGGGNAMALTVREPRWACKACIDSRPPYPSAPLSPMPRPCEFCNEPIKPEHPNTFRHTSGWFHNRAGGLNAIALAYRARRLACADCIKLRQAGLENQPTLWD